MARKLCLQEASPNKEAGHQKWLHVPPCTDVGMSRHITDLLPEILAPMNRSPSTILVGWSLAEDDGHQKKFPEKLAFCSMFCSEILKKLHLLGQIQTLCSDTI